MTAAMHVDGYSIATAIDAATADALAAAGNGIRQLTAANDVVPDDVGNTILVTSGTFTLNVPVGIPQGKLTVVNAGSGKVTLAAASDVTFTDAGLGLILDTHTTGFLYATAQDAWTVLGGAAS